MSFVPIFVPPTPPSPRSRELADRLLREILAFQDEHPAVSGSEIQEAARMAAQRARGGSNAAQGLGVAVGAGLAALLGGLLYFALRQRGGGADVPWLMIALVGALLILGLVVFASRRNL